MCGIVGVLNLKDKPPVESHIILNMLEMIRHRGPDGIGIYRDTQIGLGNARLSIIDIEGGDQPIGNENESMWIVFNGEIFNYVELRYGLEALGHVFATNSDTEVVLHLYEEYGVDCLRRLNGQFAIAIWDSMQKSLFLARDRMGIRPLYYTVSSGCLIFGSEIKSILTYPNFQAEIDPQALAELFTFWSVLSPNSIFRQVYQIPPGHYLISKKEDYSIKPYWSLNFNENEMNRSREECQIEFEELLVDAVRLRLRADVPVGAYLSGGIDSSITASIIRKYTQTPIDTFSISFSDPLFDESNYQEKMAELLGTNHQVIHCDYEQIATVFPQIIWHAETPILRTAPGPMFLLSKLVNENNYKVVLTGEGADEVLAGYDIFKEMKIRLFWSKQPESEIRPLLLGKLYQTISSIGSSNETYLRAFFGREMEKTDSPFYSHNIRWSNSKRMRRFLGERFQVVSKYDINFDLPSDFNNWSPLAKAQYLEIVTFMTPYLLSSQGDRMTMANSVEGRYPFLDHRLVEFCNRLPANYKILGLKDKRMLREMGRRLLPPDIWERHKHPYRSPIHLCFFTTPRPEYFHQLLSKSSLRDTGYFDPLCVEQFIEKMENGKHISETDEMALVGILSTQMLDYQFIKNFTRPETSFDDIDHLKFVDRVPINS
jgi:asparagine synthase (glutamine-hydrolysing)